MKLSVSLPTEDVEFLDAYARDQGAASRSAVVREALGLLRAREIGADYMQAWDEWAESGAGRDWESVVEDGVTSAS